MDRIEHIRDLQEKQFNTTRKQSTIINNFFSLISIIVISITIILYVNYVLPAQKDKEQQEIKKIQHQKHLAQRKKQIELSHKLNNPTNKRTDDNSTSK